MKQKTIFYTIVIIGIIIITAFTFSKRHQQKKQQKKASYSIIKTWEMPAELNEISGISWIGQGLIACVQDEEGKIFIYDLNQKKVVQEISFADAGDFEAITVVGKDAYVMRSDGLLFLIKNFREKTKKVSSYQTSFSAKNNIESLAFDSEKKLLLTIPKDQDKDDLHKNIYAVTLDNKTNEEKALLAISMNSPLLKPFQHKKITKTLSPSEIAINIKTGNFLVLDGRNPKLLWVDTKGNVKQVYKLDKETFAQPEGLTFSDDGRMFISNEAGKNSKANILEVKLLE